MDDARCGSCGTGVGATAKFCSECGAALARAAHSAEYKQVTVLFADVVHSMDIARVLGAERLREIMTELVNSASSVVQRYAGTVGSFTGDGIMAVFGAPTALEDHAIRACRAALAIQEEAERLAVDVAARDNVELRLRIGLNSGQVIAGEIASGPLGYTTIGEHVGIAQRMESVAPPGGVMLSASTARLVDWCAALGEPEVVRIKGADEPVPARRLLGVGQHRGVTRAESHLVGRRWEMSAVEGMLDRALDGHGGVVGVVGPPGIGKSRLTREVAAMAAQRGVPVFTAFCESHTSQVPFQVITRLMRAAAGVEGLDGEAARALIQALFSDADPDDVLLYQDLLGVGDPDAVPPRIDPDARRRRLTAMVNAASLASESSAVYVVEDAHWIDEVSESMLADFLTVVPQTPLLTLITYRPEYRGALAQVPGAHTIALAPLSDSETAELVSELLGPDLSVEELSRAISERASGTPFFAEEIVRELADRGVLQGKTGAYVSTTQAAEVTVPATLQATIAARIDRLDPKAKRTLSAAAVIGSRFGVDLLTSLGVEPDIAGLVTAQLVDQVRFTRHAEYVFHHPLIRAVAYEAQLKSDRAELHRRVANAIERQNAGSVDEHAALIAEHLESAGDLPAAFEWHMRAGTWSNNRDVAASRVSWERARQVADALPENDPHRTAMRIAARTVLCATDWRVHDNDSAVRFEELRQLCALAGDKTSLAIGMQAAVTAQHFRGEMLEASRLASEQAALLDSIGDPSLTALAAFGGIGIKAETGEMTDVMRWSEATIDWARGDPAKGNLVVGSPLAMAMMMRGTARYWFGCHGWREDLDGALAIAERADSLSHALVVSWRCIGIMNQALAADDAAMKVTEAALRTAEASGENYAVAILKTDLALLLLWRSDAADRDRALDLVAQVREMSTRQQYPPGEVPPLEFIAERESARDGDRDGAIRAMRRCVDEVISRGQFLYCVPTTALLAEAFLDRATEGDVADAEAAIEKLAALPVEGSIIRDVWLLRVRSLLARAKGDDAGYRDLRDRYRAMATSLGFEGHMAWAAAMP